MLRVILASEYPKVRHFLGGMVEGEAGAVIVGQAGSATKALTLTRNLRPDVVIIDCHLPHDIGLDSVSLSRIGGLDTAQIISEEIPSTLVVLVTNLDTEVLPEHSLASDNAAFFCKMVDGQCLPFALQKPFYEAEELGAPIFANVKVERRAASRQKLSISDKSILLGGFGVIGGLSLMITVIFAQAGAFLAVAGVVTIISGLVGKPASRLWHKTRKAAKRG